MPWWAWLSVAAGVSLVGSCFVLAFLHAAAIERQGEDELEATVWSIVRWREMDALLAERPGY